MNLVVDLSDARFDHTATHHTLEALGSYGGVVPSRFVRVPDKTLAQVDAIFGEAWSSELAAGSAWVAEDAAGLLGVAGFDARGLRYRWLRGRPRDQAVFGPFGFMKRAHPELLTAFLHGALFALRERGYATALIPAVADPRHAAFYQREAGARVAGAVPPLDRRFRTVVLASGAGSNFAAVCAGVAGGTLPLDIVGLISNRPDAPVLELALPAGVPTRVIAWDKSSEARAAYDGRLLAAVAEEAPDLILLLGWMHVLSPAFVERFEAILNIHPAFLPLDVGSDTVVYPDGSQGPALRGARAVDAALSAGMRWTGASAHRVGVEIDRGSVLARAPLAILPGEGAAALRTRLHPLEHRVVSAAIRRWAGEA